VNYQLRALGISGLLHIILVATVVIAGSLLEQGKKTIVLDFELREPTQEITKPKLPARPSEAKPVPPALREHARPTGTPRMQAAPKSSTNPETLATPELSEAERRENQPLELGVSGLEKEEKGNSTGIARGTDPNTVRTDGSKKASKIKYLNDHFAYIRDKILRNVRYPDAARRMGWQGKVVFSFVIREDGFVGRFQILQSSGFPLLDKSAMETVKETAPFPRPPGEAQLVIPITYRLD